MFSLALYSQHYIRWKRIKYSTTNSASYPEGNSIHVYQQLYNPIDINQTQMWALHKDGGHCSTCPSKAPSSNGAEIFFFTNIILAFSPFPTHTPGLVMFFSISPSQQRVTTTKSPSSSLRCLRDSSKPSSRSAHATKSNSPPSEIKLYLIWEI